MSETIELLPCPFCGGKPEKKMRGTAFTKSRFVRIRCKKCGCELEMGGVRWFFERLNLETDKAWNTRAPHQEIAGPRQEASEGKLLALIVDLEARLIPQDGCSSWDHVEDFRKAHGHLPYESAAPCKACFHERTEARVAIVRLKQAALALGDK